VRPLWQMTEAWLNDLDADLLVIPHKQDFHFRRLCAQPFYYMQTRFPWLFTLDPRGWGPNATTYPCRYDAGDPERGTYERYVERVVGANTSKFTQSARTERADLIARGDIPEGPYIFFPCQIPRDQSIRFFSPHAEGEVVAALAAWTRTRGVDVVFKAHPANPKSAAPFRDTARGEHCYWSDASVHDLIAHATAVYVINSGVGFEALLHGKPMVSFGHAEYDAVTVHGDLEDLDGAWAAVQTSDPDARLTEYKRFVDWYCRLHCVDLSDPGARDARLAALTDAMLASVEAAPCRSGL
jgi:hypothetical protein